MAPTINSLYQPYLEEYAALAQAGEDRITEALAQQTATQPAIALHVDGVIFEYRRVALALLHAVATDAPKDATPDDLMDYLRSRLAKEADVAIQNAQVRADDATRLTLQHIKSHFADLRRRGRISANDFG